MTYPLLAYIIISSVKVSEFPSFYVLGLDFGSIIVPGHYILLYLIFELKYVLVNN